MVQKRKALVISVSYYQDENLEDLDFCKNDGNEMFKFLKKNGYDIIEDRKLVGKVKYSEMKTVLIDFFRNEEINPSDTLLFYFSGHGYTDEFGDGFFCTSNIDIKVPDHNGIPFSFLTKQMDRSDSQRIIAILDCCHSGATLQSNIGRVMGPTEKEAQAVKQGRASLKKEFEQGQGRCILASSLSNKVSYGLQGKPYSAYTYYVLEGLKKNKKTYDNEGHVTPEKLSYYVSDELKKIQKENFQKPVTHSSITGKLILAEYPEVVDSTSTTGKNIEVLMEEADDCLKHHKYNQAIRAYNQVLLIDSENLKAWNNKGKAFEVGLDDYYNALVCYNRALEIDNNAHVVWYNKGNVLTKKMEYKNALVCFDNAIKLKSDKPNYWCNKGKILYKLKRKKEAEECFKKSKELKSNV